MTLDIDATSPIRTLARYRELVRAILNGSPSIQETQWVEWKSGADVREKRWQAQLSRQILGFANRDPDAAATWLGGCAYVVVGVSPGNLVGTPGYDGTQLEAWLSAYVGHAPTAPEWAASYVEVDGKNVLVLTVEPPKVGHPIWTLQKDFPVLDDADDKVPYRAGSVFVRRKASTGLASPAEMEMLSRRLIAATARKRVGGLSLIVRPGSRAVPLDLGDAALAPWIDREKAALAPPPEKPQAQPSADHAFGDRDFGLGQKFTALALAGAMYGPDARTREAYEDEVGKYIETATVVLPAVLIRRAYEREMGRIDLTIRNETDDPIHQLRVELYIRAEGVMAISGDADLPDVSLPQRPVEFGRGGRNRFDLSGLSAFRSPFLSPVIPGIGRRVTIDNSGSTRVTFDPIDLYPQESYDLDAFYLFVSSLQAGQTLTGEWTARAKDASGVLTDSVVIDVDPATPTVDQLLTELPIDDGQQDNDT